MRCITTTLIATLTLTLLTAIPALADTWTETVTVECLGNKHKTVEVECSYAGERLAPLEIEGCGPKLSFGHTCGVDPTFVPAPEPEPAPETETDAPPPARLGVFAEVGYADTGRPGGTDAARGLLGLRLEIPTAFAPMVGLEFALGAGVDMFPGQSPVDCLGTATVDAGLIFSPLDWLSFAVGYRFLSEFDVDEAWAHAHVGRVRVGFDVADRVQVGLGVGVGGAVWTVQTVHTESNAFAEVEITTTSHQTSVVWDVGASVLWRFW